MSSSTPAGPSPSKDYYELRVPIASCIYPRSTREETLSILIHMNKSLKPKKRLPAEILLLINNEIHIADDSYSENLRSTWSPFLEQFEPSGRTFWTKFNEDKKSFSFPEKQERDGIDLTWVVSSADLLYRVRCLFPEIFIDTHGDKYKTIWRAGLQHNQSGGIIIFTEHKSYAKLLMKNGEYEKGFSEDLLQLLNMLFGTVDGKRFTYYHPAAYADLPTADQHYLAVPGKILDYSRETRQAYSPWNIVIFPVEDLTSSTFKSLLPQLKYNPKLRKVDLENGTEDLTTIMSSSLLFYRLICQWTKDHINLNDKYPVTSIWQVEVEHREHNVWVLFVDDRGLFDIRVEGDVAEAMDDIITLVNALFSDECSHPCGRIIAGTF